MKSPERIPITRHDTDGTVVDGTAAFEGGRVWDFRDLDGEPLPLPPMSKYSVSLDHINIRTSD